MCVYNDYLQEILEDMMKKRFLSMLLAILMVLSLVPGSVFAEDILPIENEMNDESTSTEEVTRYTVLVLDTSGSMRGNPATKQNIAATKFCESILAAKGINKVAIISLNTSSSVVCKFTDELNELKECINSLYASGGTNINQALEVAGQLLDEIQETDKTIKNIVLCSDGLPEDGKTTTEGPYTSSDYNYYSYANYCYNTATTLKVKNYIYTLGFFHSLSGSNLSFANRFMNDLQNSGYYEVNDPEDLEFTFGDIAEDITRPLDGEFQYGSQLSDMFASYSFSYDDSWFNNASTVYNHELAKMSMRMTMAGCNTRNGRDKALFIKKLLKDLN